MQSQSKALVISAAVRSKLAYTPAAPLRPPAPAMPAAPAGPIKPAAPAMPKAITPSGITSAPGGAPRIPVPQLPTQKPPATVGGYQNPELMTESQVGWAKTKNRLFRNVGDWIPFVNADENYEKYERALDDRVARRPTGESFVRRSKLNPQLMYDVEAAKVKDVNKTYADAYQKMQEARQNATNMGVQPRYISRYSPSGF